ncbi:PadR family transcriptional regulator [[Eubacterium] cellulosolvens]
MVDLEKAWRERMVKNHLDLIILKLLKIKSRWGYELNLEIRDRFQVYLSAGTLYPLLHSLEEEDHIIGVREHEKKRGRRIYKITEKGEKFLSIGENAAETVLRRLRIGESKIN